jgi:hypothetical protein
VLAQFSWAFTEPYIFSFKFQTAEALIHVYMIDDEITQKHEKAGEDKSPYFAPDKLNTFISL